MIDLVAVTTLLEFYTSFIFLFPIWHNGRNAASFGFGGYCVCGFNC
jgi:hypothetical protein